MCQIFFNIKKRILSEIQDLKYYKTSFNSLFRKSLSNIVEINADQNSDPYCIEATSDAADEGANHAYFEWEHEAFSCSFGIVAHPSDEEKGAEKLTSGCEWNCSEICWILKCSTPITRQWTGHNQDNKQDCTDSITDIKGTKHFESCFDGEEKAAFVFGLTTTFLYWWGCRNWLLNFVLLILSHSRDLRWQSRLLCSNLNIWLGVCTSQLWIRRLLLNHRFRIVIHPCNNMLLISHYLNLNFNFN